MINDLDLPMDEFMKQVTKGWGCEPFGTEWQEGIKKLNKSHLIGIIRRQGLKIIEMQKTIDKQTQELIEGSL